MSAADEVDPAEYPHLKISPAELQAAYEADAVIRQYRSDCDHFQRKLDEYPQKIEVQQAELASTEAQVVDLQGQMRVLDMQIRTIKGAISGTRFHEGATRQRMMERETAIQRRKRQIYHREVKIRLNRLAKDLNLSLERKTFRKNGLDDEHETLS